MSDGDPEDRAKKLQGRFSRPPADEASNTSEASDTSDSSGSSNTSNTPSTSEAGGTSDTPGASDTPEASDTGETTPLRDRPTKLLYLDEDLKKELELAFDELNLRYKRERDEELRQNDDWWPVLLRVGAEAIGDVSDVDLETFDQARADQFSVPESDSDSDEE